MISLRDLSYVYPNSEAPAIANISVEFPRERIFAVLGESGSGKTTLLNCIARFLTPTRGHIAIDDRDISEMPRAGVSPYPGGGVPEALPLPASDGAGKHDSRAGEGVWPSPDPTRGMQQPRCLKDLALST